MVVFITASSAKRAEQIAQTVLEKRLAACINILPCVHSRFWWKRKIERCDETLMIIKTKSEVFYELVESVRAIHSYQVPEILAIPVQSGFTKYLTWIDEVVKRTRHQGKKCKGDNLSVRHGLHKLSSKRNARAG